MPIDQYGNPLPYDEAFSPPPSPPPPGQAMPPMVGGMTPGPNTPAPSPGGGGGPMNSPAPPSPPPIPGVNIPGAPQFVAPKFSAPTMEQVKMSPGYQTRLDAANRALERSAAAKGMLRGGNTLTDIYEQSQNFAEGAYDSAFNRALAGYDREYRGASDAFAPQFAAWKLRSEALANMTRDRFGAELGVWARPPSGGGGGGGNMFDPAIFDLLMPQIPVPQAPGGNGLPGGGDTPYVPMAFGQGDPWTDPDTFY